MRALPSPTSRWRARCRFSTSRPRPRPRQRRRASWRRRCRIASAATPSRSQPTVDGGSVAGLAAVKEHLATYPRDAMVLAPCTGVFGLIGFSGRAGRESRAAGAARSARGRLRRRLVVRPARTPSPRSRPAISSARIATIERSLALQPAQRQRPPTSAPTSTTKRGERQAGLAYLEEWWRGLSEGEPAALPSELAHRALAAGARPRRGRLWSFYRAHLRPGASTGPPHQHALRLRLVPVPRRDGGRGARPRAVARAQPVRHAVVSLARHRLRRRARALAHALAGDADALAKIIDARQGTGTETRWRHLAAPSAPSAARIGPRPRSRELQTVMDRARARRRQPRPARPHRVCAGRMPAAMPAASDEARRPVADAAPGAAARAAGRSRGI